MTKHQHLSHTGDHAASVTRVTAESATHDMADASEPGLALRTARRAEVVVSLQRRFGNAAVARLVSPRPATAALIGRDTLLQRDPDDSKPEATGDLALPWKHGDYSLFEVTSSGIRVLVGATTDQEKSIRGTIPAIAKRVTEGNMSIADPARQVKTTFVVPTTTRFALWNGQSVLMIDVADANAETAAHEMGHAIFYALKTQADSNSKDAPKAANFRLQVADIYARLAQTKAYTDMTVAAGLLIADPAEWAPGHKSEHPWSDPDEFFASAREAFLIDRDGFKRAIARFTKFDPAVAGPAKELLALLSAFLGKKHELTGPGVPEARLEDAQRAQARETGVSLVEDTAGSSPLLYWLITPDKRQGQRRPRP